MLPKRHVVRSAPQNMQLIMNRRHVAASYHNEGRGQGSIIYCKYNYMAERYSAETSVFLGLLPLRALYYA